MAFSIEEAVAYPFRTLLIAYVVYLIGTRIYNVYFHPIAKFPGPWYRGAFTFPFHLEQLRGISPYSIHALHQKYGPVVRLAPDVLSFTTSNAWKDIYGSRSDRKQIPKDYKRFVDAPDYLPLLTSHDEDHARMRKLVSHAFSETALREQEPLIQEHILELGRQFQSIAQSSPEIDMDVWIDRLSFDIISDLTFGESFGGVTTSSNPKFINDCYVACTALPFMLMSWDYEPVKWLLKLMFMLPSVKLTREGDKAATKARVDKRLALKDENRKDFMTYISRYNDERGVTRGELEGMTVVFMAAGGEEPASLITGCLWFLLRNPETLKTVQKELDEAFEQSKPMTNLELTKLPLLNAVIKETARIRPPGAGHFNRRTDRPTVLDGHVVPAGISVEVSSYAACHSPANFSEPDKWVADRWLPTPPPEYAADDLNASQPFATGPRQCLGKNLANLMLRTTLAHILWSFDLTLSEKSQDWWAAQKFRTVWHRTGLFVSLLPRHGKEGGGQGLMGLSSAKTHD